MVPTTNPALFFATSPPIPALEAPFGWQLPTINPMLAPAPHLASPRSPETARLEFLSTRAILSVGMQLGPRRMEIARMIVSDLHMHNGYWCLKVLRKGNKEGREVINPETERRIRKYLELAGHIEDTDGPMFRPTRKNHVKGTEDMRRHLAPKTINRVIQHWCKVAIGIASGFSAHSMRATFATRALNNGADLVNVKNALGHADVSTTLIYDHRADDPDQAASSFAKY
ncbi:MAG: site-specific integrase [Halieaceae bacterium]|nr:site-specific integrase [Halieaceae bacterium]